MAACLWQGREKWNFEILGEKSCKNIFYKYFFHFNTPSLQVDAFDFDTAERRRVSLGN